MSLVFERFQTEGIAELSYLLGDDEQGVAAVFDPTPDVEKYVELAREKNVAITHIFETHIHADLMSGSRELCARFFFNDTVATDEYALPLHVASEIVVRSRWPPGPHG